MSTSSGGSAVNSFPITNWDEIYSNSCSLDLLRHDNLINYPRCLARGQPYCVMCGKIKGLECEIPNQNKDVCKTCDSVVWKVEKLNIVVKFCKGCKNFSLLSSFGEKPMAAKCSKCRQRGRQHYHSKKKLENPPTPATTSSFTIQYYPEHRNQIFLTPPPTHSSNGRTISPLLPMHCSPTFLEPISPSPSLSHLFISPQSVSCAEILESSIEGDISNLTSPLCHEIPLQKPPTLWDPSAHPLLNLAALSEQLLTPVPALLSPSPSPPSEKKRKR